jgi:trimeric autotransporter adhesin
VRRVRGSRAIARLLPVAIVAGTLVGGSATVALGLGPTLLSITVSPTTASVAKGDTQQFTATGHYSDLSTQNLTDSVTWSSSSSSVTISNASGSQGLATAASTGVATITAADPSALVQGTAAMTVTPAVVTAVTVSPSATSINKGGTQQFTATGVYSDLSTADLTASVTWSSSSSSVTISNASGSQGLATGVSAGAATITATDPSSLIQGTAVATVLPAVLSAVTVTPASAVVAQGTTEQFTATGVYSDLSTADLTDSVTWSASTGATVSNAPGSQGLATGVAVGTSTITATDPSSLIQGTAVLTVTPGSLSPTPQLTVIPDSGLRKSSVTAQGTNFTPGDTVTIAYFSALKSHKRAQTTLCTSTVDHTGTFSCTGTIPGRIRSGRRGLHQVVAQESSGPSASASFTLVRRRTPTH